MPKSQSNSRGTRVTRALLRHQPIPSPESDDDKDSRGRVLVVGGEISLPGAVVLAGIAALRAGAGKLQIATCRTIAPHIGVSVPESLCLGVDETSAGTMAISAVTAIAPLAQNADAVLIGPGTSTGDEVTLFTTKLLVECTGKSMVLDAAALGLLTDSPNALQSFGGNVVITPHAGEMATILGIEKKEVMSDAHDIAIRAATKLGAVVALKGSDTFIATPDGDCFRYSGGDVGLATSGSGDTLAGIIAGLMARGSDPVDAALWGVFLHGAAGNVLARRMGKVGYLARELLDEIPAIMNRI